MVASIDPERYPAIFSAQPWQLRSTPDLNPELKARQIKDHLLNLQPPPLCSSDVAAYKAETLRQYSGLRVSIGGISNLLVAAICLSSLVAIVSFAACFIAVGLTWFFPGIIPITRYLFALCLLSTAAVFFVDVVLRRWGNPNADASNVSWLSSKWAVYPCDSGNYLYVPTQDRLISIPPRVTDLRDQLKREIPDLNFELELLAANQWHLLPCDPFFIAVLPDHSRIYLTGWNLERAIKPDPAAG